MYHHPHPQRTPTRSTRPSLPSRTPLSIILIVLLATTILGCTNSDPAPTPNLEATIQAQLQSARHVEDSVKATVEANIPVAQAVQTTLEARAQATPRPTTRPFGSQIAITPTPVPQIALADQNCDQLLQEHLVYQTAATDAYTMQGVIRQIQAGTEKCSADLWNPKIVDPQPQEAGTCLVIANRLDPSRLPPGLLTPDGTSPRPTSGRDPANNLIAYWSKFPTEKPQDLSNCWIYLSDLNSWMTGQDLKAKTTTFTRINLNQGDCLVFAESLEHADFTPAKVPCDQEWTHRVVSSFETTDPGYYPTSDQFQKQFFLHCSPRHTFALYPLQPAWIAGDRKVTCLQNSFGLSLTDPDKLDRMVGPPSLTPSDCFNRAPESAHVQVEIVDCSTRWHFRVLNTFQATNSTEYPGELRLWQESVQYCDRRTTVPIHPDPLTWSLDYRKIHCLQENQPGQPGTPEILDRLINTHTVNPGECFNTYKTPDLYLAELIPCSGTWEFQVTRETQVPSEGPYPGDQYIWQTIQEACDVESHPKFLAPKESAWNEGHRTIICLLESGPPPRTRARPHLTPPPQRTRPSSKASPSPRLDNSTKPLPSYKQPSDSSVAPPP